MANRYVRSLFWLFSFTGLGYALLKITEPSEEQLRELRKYPGSSNTTEVNKKTQAYLDVLQLAADSKTPLYRMNKEQIERELGKK